MGGGKGREGEERREEKGGKEAQLGKERSGSDGTSRPPPLRIIRGGRETGTEGGRECHIILQY